MARERRGKLCGSSHATRRDEELAVAVAAENGGGGDADDLPVVCGNEGGNVVANRGVDERVAHDAFLGPTAAGFELRLDQRQQLRWLSHEVKDRR